MHHAARSKNNPQARMTVSIFLLESEFGVSELFQLVDTLGRG
jgi:hypothetical protein